MYFVQAESPIVEILNDAFYLMVTPDNQTMERTGLLKGKQINQKSDTLLQIHIVYRNNKGLGSLRMCLGTNCSTTYM